MALQARKIAGTDYGVSFTGVAGPDELEGQPVGTVWIALAYGDERWSFHRNIDSPETARSDKNSAVMQGFDLLRRQVLRKNKCEYLFGFACF